MVIVGLFSGYGCPLALTKWAKWIPHLFLPGIGNTSSLTKNNIGMRSACIVEGNIQMGNSYWFGIIPFFSYSTQNSSLHFRNTFLILLTMGFLTKWEPNSLSGVGSMAFYGWEPGDPKLVPPGQARASLWGGAGFSTLPTHQGFILILLISEKEEWEREKGT